MDTKYIVKLLGINHKGNTYTIATRAKQYKTLAGARSGLNAMFFEVKDNKQIIEQSQHFKLAIQDTKTGYYIYREGNFHF